MAKSIHTLVPDIYKVITGEIKATPEQTEDLGKRMGSMIASRLGSNSEPRVGALRMSALGTKCQRKLWYAVNHPESAEPLAPHTYQKFLMGDIAEVETLWAAEVAGHDIQLPQAEVVIHGVKGHIDAIIDGVLVDVKTANSRGFLKFKNHELAHNDPFGYTTQLNLYLEALQETQELKVRGEYAFLAVDKELGHIVLDKYRADKSRDYRALVSDAISSVGRDAPPPRGFSSVPDGKSGNMKLCMECKYCPHKKQCWPGMRTYVYSTGPEYLVTVAKEPRVAEEKN